ncbi:MAG: hypothetical protein B7Y25_05795 [Alphaproteobacteria bacterium 16-39-46]|nr:MAG: hypothetical protein B7Y25_05795 [Alphaproteobacteria bacterium 16-39-46]OZA42543.1 MAG: hypothetical protein B7X84_05720 [Alphaproteobacteria bacterium 17-39-52]HQS83548.1 hypothetical protein [Alphaproteobacteria bacterium]HQS93303.1 hypothetical protein [Alphaproteobacteria bacterium]
MNFIRHDLRKNLFKKGVFSIFVGMLAFVQASNLRAIPPKLEDIAINEPEEKPRPKNVPSSKIFESESECNGCMTSVKTPVVEVKVDAKKSKAKIKF